MKDVKVVKNTTYGNKRYRATTTDPRDVTPQDEVQYIAKSRTYGSKAKRGTSYVK